MAEPEDGQRGSERAGAGRRRRRPAGAGERGVRGQVAAGDAAGHGDAEAGARGARASTARAGGARESAARARSDSPSGSSNGDPAESPGDPARARVSGHEGAHDPLHGPEGSPWVRYERLREELGGDGLSRPSLPDLSALIAVLEGLRALVPRELSDQFTALLRELLLTLRTVIDWYLERLEPDEREPEVEEIPIE